MCFARQRTRSILLKVPTCCQFSSRLGSAEKYPVSWIICNSLNILPQGNRSILLLLHKNKKDQQMKSSCIGEERIKKEKKTTNYACTSISDGLKITSQSPALCYRAYLAEELPFFSPAINKTE